MPTRLAKPLIIAAAAACLVVAVALAGDVHFSYHYPEDYSQGYKMKFNQEVSFGQFSMSEFVDMEVTERRVGVDEEGTLSMELTFDKVEASRVQFDNMVESPLGEQLTGQAVTYKLDKFGDVTEIEPAGYIDVWDDIHDRVEAFLMYAYMPDKVVAQGESWSEDAKEEEDEGMKTVTTSAFTFKEMKKEKGLECAVVEGNIENVITGTNENPMGTFAVDGKGKGSIEMLFDPKTSAIVKLKGKMELNMNMVPEGAGQEVNTIVTIQMEKALK